MSRHKRNKPMEPTEETKPDEPTADEMAEAGLLTEEPAPAVSDGLIPVTFNGGWTKYNPGETAGFEEHMVKKLEGMQTMDARGNKGPLISRYKKPVLDRLGITKGAPESKPIGGTDERKVIGSDSNELVGGPAHRKP